MSIETAVKYVTDNYRAPAQDESLEGYFRDAMEAAIEAGIDEGTARVAIDDLLVGTRSHESLKKFGGALRRAARLAGIAEPAVDVEADVQEPVALLEPEPIPAYEEPLTLDRRDKLTLPKLVAAGMVAVEGVDPIRDARDMLVQVMTMGGQQNIGLEGLQELIDYLSGESWRAQERRKQIGAQALRARSFSLLKTAEEVKIPHETWQGLLQTNDTETAKAIYQTIASRAGRRRQRGRVERETVVPAEDDEPAALDMDIDDTPFIDDDATYEQLGDTRLTTNAVKDYLRQIGKVELLNAEQEVELSKRIEAGLCAAAVLEGEEIGGFSLEELDESTVRDLQALAQQGKQARDHMLEANLRLVVSLAKRYTGRNMPFLDLIQEGNLGLVRAVEKFDYKKGYKFSTYASWWIRQAITRAMADKAEVIRKPVHMQEKINKITRTRRAMVQDLGREPTDDEVAAKLNMSTKTLQELVSYGKDPVSLSTPVGQEDGRELADFIEDDEARSPHELLLAAAREDQLREVLNTLSEREATVIILRYGLNGEQPMSLDQVGKIVGVTRERVRQVQKKTEAKLAHPARGLRL